MEDILDTIYKILREDYGAKGEMTLETRIDDIGIDSVDLIGFLYALEESTGIKIPDEMLGTEKLSTLGQFADYVASHRASA